MTCCVPGTDAQFYGFLSAVYVVLALAWAFLCWRHYRELLPMQMYISGTVAFLVLEMLALFGYYRYVNKHGGGAGSLAFLLVTAVLSAGRTTLSLFLLLIVSMGLSVVTQSLGAVMPRVWALTAFHFVFGVAYSVGTVKVALDTAPAWVVLALIFPLSVTLTAFLMWIIVSLNGTILFLKERRQYFKLAMFERLWRILVGGVIATAAFFVLSTVSLSARGSDDYEPSHWRWRWVLLDASLATIYLVVFALIAWLWRPTENNVRFSTSQELAQDDDDAAEFDVEAYERRPEALGMHALGGDASGAGASGVNGANGVNGLSPAAIPTAQPPRARDEFAHEASEGKALFDAGDSSDSDSEDDDDAKKKRPGRAQPHTTVPPVYRRVGADGRPVTVPTGQAANGGYTLPVPAPAPAPGPARVQEDSQIFSMGDSSDDDVDVRSAVSIDLSEDEGLLKSKRD